jgi:hypothetical protein
LPFAYCSLPIAYCSLLIAYCPLLIAYRPLPIAHCPLPIAHWLLQDVPGAQKVALPVNFCKDISVNNTFYATSKVLYNQYRFENV